jgi:cobalt-zinc-cadmium efflux system outer membrane protein
MPRYILYAHIILTIIFMPISPARAQKLTLNDVIREAVANNPDLLKAERDYKTAKARLWEGVSPTYPELFMEFGGVPRGYPWSDFRERKTGLVQGIEFPLAYAFRGHWHILEKNRTFSEYERMRNELVSNVKKKFYRVILLHEKIHLYDEIERITRENFQKARIRVFAGETSPYDTLKLKVDLAEVENELFALRTHLALHHSELVVLLGREIGDSLQVKGSLTYSPISIDQDSLRKAALSHQPVLREAEFHVRQKKVMRNLAWTKLLPDLKLKYFRHELPDIPLNDAWGGEIGLSIPLWFFFRGQGSIRAAAHQAQAAAFRYESKKRNILLAVDEAVSQLLIAEHRVTNYQENTLKEVEELVRIATRSYEIGEMGYVELAEALRTLNRIKAGYFESLYRYLAAQADLEKAVGIILNEGDNQ